MAGEYNELNKSGAHTEFEFSQPNTTDFSQMADLNRALLSPNPRRALHEAAQLRVLRPRPPVATTYLSSLASREEESSGVQGEWHILVDDLNTHP